MAARQVSIRFFGDLRDFLDKNQDQPVLLDLFGKPTVKDLIEGIGIPQAEVFLVKVNDRIVALSQHPESGDFVAVYPYPVNLKDYFQPDLKQGPVPARIIADVHLGKLVRLLRLAGLDVYYRNDLEDQEIIDLAAAESRLILTRDLGILKNSRVQFGYFVRSTDPNLQFPEIIERFHLHPELKPFSRCLVCNGQIQTVDLQEISQTIPPRVRDFQKEFYQCNNCSRVFWKGSHYKRMQEFLKTFGLVV